MSDLSLWERLRAVKWGRVAAGSGLALLVIAVVPPFRQAAAVVTSKIVLVVASPLTPGLGGFDELAKASRVLAADGTEVGRLGAEQREPVRLDQLPAHVPKAVLAAEDSRFYSHSGVDPPAVLRAVFNSAKGGGVTGGSTITQQLAKLNYTGSERTLFRKLKEVLYATRLENKYSKDQLLERYLNQVYFGHGAYGIEVASQVYFAVPPQELTPAQAATLAGKIQAPNALDPYRAPDAVQARRDHVLRAMNRHNWLPSEQLEAALTQPLEVAPDPGSRSAAAKSAGPAKHFIDFVGREAAGVRALGNTAEARRKQAYTGGYTFETTLDPKALEEAAAATKRLLGKPGDPTTAIVSVEPGNGAIRVLFGGLDPKLEFDPASQGRRQPGSSFKPYVYLAMLDQRIDPRSNFDSGSPKTLQCQDAPWAVKNYEGEGGGPSTVDDAMVHSINTVFAQIMAKVGPSAVQKVAEKAGISHEAVTPAECAMALGGLERGVSPLEHASGFATFAAKGVYAKPYAIARIKDRNGRVVYEHEVDAEQAIDAKQVGVLNAALKRVVESGTGSAAAIGRPVAGKTGTTENYGNAWFVGFVPQRATAVWVGHPEGDVPMTNVHGIQVTGGSFPARIFGQYMRTALAGMPVQEIYTASPDELGLRPPIKSGPSTSSTTTSSTTSSTVPETTTSSMFIDVDLSPTTTVAAFTPPPQPPNPRPPATSTVPTSTTAPPATVVKEPGAKPPDGKND